MIRRVWWALFAFWVVVYGFAALVHGLSFPVLLSLLGVVIGGSQVLKAFGWLFPPRPSLVDYRRIRYLERELDLTPGPLMAKGAPHATQEIDPTDYKAWQEPPEGWRPGDPLPTHGPSSSLRA